MLVLHFCFHLLQPIPSVTLVMTGVLSLMLGGFLLYHLRLASCNLTTNEMYKYDGLEQYEREQRDKGGKRTWALCALDTLDSVTCRNRIRRHQYDEGCLSNFRRIVCSSSV